MDEIFFMKEALKEAKKAYAAGEVPVGAVLVFQEKIVSRGYNQVELLRDATAHAEILCITAASEAIANWRLEGMTLYTTLEPCAMCAGALFNARVKKVVWGAPDLRVGAGGSWVNLFAENHPIHSIEVVSGICAEESAELMRRFFQERRKK